MCKFQYYYTLNLFEAIVFSSGIVTVALFYFIYRSLRNTAIHNLELHTLLIRSHTMNFNLVAKVNDLEDTVRELKNTVDELQRKMREAEVQNIPHARKRPRSSTHKSSRGNIRSLQGVIPSSPMSHQSNHSSEEISDDSIQDDTVPLSLSEPLLSTSNIQSITSVIPSTSSVPHTKSDDASNPTIVSSLFPGGLPKI